MAFGDDTCLELSSQPAFACSKLTMENTRTRCKIWSKLTIMTPERRQWHRSGVFIVTFEHVISSWVVIGVTSLNCPNRFIKSI